MDIKEWEIKKERLKEVVELFLTQKAQAEIGKKNLENGKTGPALTVGPKKQNLRGLMSYGPYPENLVEIPISVCAV